MSGNRHDIDLVKSELIADLIGQFADLRSGRNDLREDILRKFQPVDHFIGPLALLRIEKLCRGCDGILGLLLSRKEVIEEVRHQDHLIRTVKQVFPVLQEIEQLECRIDLHELIACDLIELLPVDHLEAFFKHALCTAVTVVDRILKESALGIHQAEIHAPCINTNTLDLSAFLRFDKPLFDLKEKAEHIPVHGAV